MLIFIFRVINTILIGKVQCAALGILRAFYMDCKNKTLCEVNKVLCFTICTSFKLMLQIRKTQFETTLSNLYCIVCFCFEIHQSQ